MFAAYLELHPLNLLTALIFVGVVFWGRLWYYSDGIPPVKAKIPIVGNLLEYGKDMVGYIKKAGNKYGEVFKVDLLLANTVWLNGTSLNREYLYTREDVWSFGDGMGVFLNKVSAPSFWPHLRSFVASLSRGISNNAAIEHYAKLASIETDKAIESWSEKKEPLMLFKDVSSIVHRTIVQCMMGPDFYEYADELFDLLHVMEANLGSIWNFILPEWFPHPAAKKLWKARDQTRALFDRLLAEREKEPERWKDSLDYISYTLRDPGTAHLKDKYSTLHTLLLFAAHTSSVAGAAWTIVELVKSPEHLARLRKDLEENPNPEKSEFLDALMKETVRQYVAFNDMRLARQPKTLTNTSTKKPITVPAGVMVSISPYLTHHDPATWESPDEYLPERWLKEPDLAKKVNSGGHVRYVPFGAGSHRCPGERMALMMMKTIVAKVVTQCDISWPEGGGNQDLTLTNLDFGKIGSPWSKEEIRVTVKPRA